MAGLALALVFVSTQLSVENLSFLLSRLFYNAIKRYQLLLSNKLLFTKNSPINKEITI